MTIARRGVLTLDPAIATPAIPPQPSPGLPPGRPMGAPPLPMGDVPASDATTPTGRLRRCIFRRIDTVTPPARLRGQPSYQVMCLYGDGDSPLPLGDVASARPICEACTAPGIFRPDEA